MLASVFFPIGQVGALLRLLEFQAVAFAAFAAYAEARLLTAKELQSVIAAPPVRAA